MQSFLANDALLLGTIVSALLIIVFAGRWLFRQSRDSSRARLRRILRVVETRRREHEAARKAVKKARAAVGALRARGERAKPRSLWEAEERLSERERELREAAEEVRMLEKELRRVIEAEYPRSKQERLLRRHLPQAARQDRPFGF